MIVNDLDLMRIAVLPSEADAPLIVDPNTVLPSALPSQLLQSIPRRDAQIIEGFRGIDDNQLSQHGAPEVARVSADPLPLEQPLGVPIAEALDHFGSYSWGTITSSVTICAS